MNNFVGHVEQRATTLQAQLQQLETQVGLVTTQDARITVDDKALGNPWRSRGFSEHDSFAAFRPRPASAVRSPDAVR